MSRASRDRASKLREFKDKLQEYHETRSRESGCEMLAAMRKHDMKTFERAQDVTLGELDDERIDREDHLKKWPIHVTKKETDNGSD